MTNDIETLSKERRREWFRHKVAEIGELLRQLPAARQEEAVSHLESESYGLERLTDKLRRLGSEEPDNARKTCSEGGCVKGNGSFSESPLDARRKCLPETCATDKNKMK
jgi:hypothetical protein